MWTGGAEEFSSRELLPSCTGHGRCYGGGNLLRRAGEVLGVAACEGDAQVFGRVCLSEPTAEQTRIDPVIFNSFFCCRRNLMDFIPAAVL